PAARASLRGMSPSTRAPAPIAAITRNHSRRVLLVTLLLTVHPPIESCGAICPGGSRGQGTSAPPVAPRVLTPYLPRSGVLTPLTPSPFGRGSPVQPPGSTCAYRNNMLSGAVFRFGGRNSRREHGSYGSPPACP